MPTNNLDFDAALAECAASMRGAIFRIRRFDDQDSFQDACLGLWIGLPRFDGRGGAKLLSFAIRIAINAAYTQNRSHRTSAKCLFDRYRHEYSIDRIDPERRAIARETWSRVLAGITQAEHREALLKAAALEPFDHSAGEKTRVHRARVAAKAIAKAAGA